MTSTGPFTMTLAFPTLEQMEAATTAIRRAMESTTTAAPASEPSMRGGVYLNDLSNDELENVLRERLHAEGRTLRITNKPGRKPAAETAETAAAVTAETMVPGSAPEQDEPEPEPELPSDTADTPAFDTAAGALRAALSSSDNREVQRGRAAMRAVQVELGVMNMNEIETVSERERAAEIINDVLAGTPDQQTTEPGPDAAPVPEGNTAGEDTGLIF